MSTSNAAHQLDASPRRGQAGFVRVDSGGDLLISDAPGHNRLDSLENIIATGQLGLLFMIPGINETLRVTMGRVLREQTGLDISDEAQQEIERRYAGDL